MTDPSPAELYIPPPTVGYNPGKGCSSCGSPDTSTVDGISGRRCTEHPPVFDPDTAVDLAVRGLPGAAGAYVRAWEET